MQRSEEIEAVMREMVEGIGSGDVAGILARMSQEPGTVIIGSAAEEYTRDHAVMERALHDSTPQGASGIHVKLDEVAGFAEGDIGWADSTGRFERDGESAPTRFTCVLRREGGEWRVVQAHASIPVPNDRMFDAMFREGAAAAS